MKKPFSAITSHNENLTKLDGLERIGKKLWEGSFSSGSIRVPNGAKYGLVVMIIDYIPCFGSYYAGVGATLNYASYGIIHRAYRFNNTIDGDDVILTIDNNSRGGSNGSSNAPITKIYGLV